MAAYPLVRESVRMDIRVERIVLGVDQAIPCGLIVKN